MVSAPFIMNFMFLFGGFLACGGDLLGQVGRRVDQLGRSGR